MSAPKVSVILPTYNRADTIGRAVSSVAKQTFQDWELIVIDDGSTDATPQLKLDDDPRVRVIRQANAGVAAARNTGIASARGQYIAFLDSDDEWLPHYLDVSIGFLESSKEDQFVSSEFYKDNTDERHQRDAIRYTYLRAARTIGSQMLELPPGEDDDYLRVWTSKEPLGPWGAKFVPPGRSEFLYRGNVFAHTRWGYLSWLPTTVVTRRALDVVGLFDPQLRTGEDYSFCALLARNFRFNFISLPGARKHEAGAGGAELTQDHLATGSSSYTFRINRLKSFDAIHWNSEERDEELDLVRKHYQYYTGVIALLQGRRAAAIKHFQEAACLKSHFWRAYVILGALKIIPQDLLALLLRRV